MFVVKVSAGVSPLSARPEMASVPAHVAVIVTADVVALVDTVTKKSIVVEPPVLIVREADALADK